MLCVFVHNGTFTTLPSTLLGVTTIASLAIELDPELWDHDRRFTLIQIGITDTDPDAIRVKEKD